MKPFGRDAALAVLQGGVATVALFLAYLSLPLVGVAGGVLTPFPALFCSLKYGRGCGLAVAGVAGAALLAYSPGGAAVYLIQGAVLSLALAEAFRRGDGAGRAIFAATVSSTVVACAGLVLASVAAGSGLHRLVVAAIDSIIRQSIEVYRSTGLKPEELRSLEQGLQQTGELLSQIYPSLLILFLALVAATNALLAVKLAGRLPNVPIRGPFAGFRNRDHLVWMLIAAGFSLLVPATGVRFVALNLLVVALTLYFVQGLAIAAAMFQRHSVARPWRFLFYLMIVVQPYVAVALTALGLFDLWLDFRRPRNRENL
ncbi:MAG TPA: YybS family protein [Verrucomicrobiae bacterium]|nr:YybS family protein [Verrucomicrobiae bacterium]